MEVSIAIDSKPVQDYLISIGYGKQTEFALSKSLNDLAKIVQADMKAGLESRFTLNRKTWVFNQIKILKENWSTKSKLTVIIGITNQADFLKAMELGGEHLPGMGRKTLALPNPQVFKGKPIMKTNPLAIKNLALTKTRAGIQGANNTFLVKTQSSSNVRGLILQHTQEAGAKRKGKAGTNKDTGNRLLYTLVSRTKRPAKLQFIVTANLAVEKNWEPIFQKNILDAIKSSKRKG